MIGLMMHQEWQRRKQEWLDTYGSSAGRLAVQPCLPSFGKMTSFIGEELSITCIMHYVTQSQV